MRVPITAPLISLVWHNYQHLKRKVCVSGSWFHVVHSLSHREEQEPAILPALNATVLELQSGFGHLLVCFQRTWALKPVQGCSPDPEGSARRQGDWRCSLVTIVCSCDSSISLCRSSISENEQRSSNLFCLKPYI